MYDFPSELGHMPITKIRHTLSLPLSKRLSLREFHFLDSIMGEKNCISKFMDILFKWLWIFRPLKNSTTLFFSTFHNYFKFHENHFIIKLKINFWFKLIRREMRLAFGFLLQQNMHIYIHILLWTQLSTSKWINDFKLHKLKFHRYLCWLVSFNNIVGNHLRTLRSPYSGAVCITQDTFSKVSFWYFA